MVFPNVLRTCSVRAPCFRAFCLLRDKHRGIHVLRFREVGWVRGGQGACTRLFDGNLVSVNGNPGVLRWKTLCFSIEYIVFLNGKNLKNKPPRTVGRN